MGDQIIMFISQIFNGLKIGSVYSLVALGYTMVYGIIRLINFAHGDFIMVGSYALMLTIPFIIACGLPAWFAVIPAVLVCVAVGIIVERAAYKPVREKGNNMTALITAIAMSLLLENGSQALFGADYQTVPTIVEIPTLVLGKLKIDGATIITVLLGIAISTLFRHRENSLLLLLWTSIPVLMLSGVSFPREAIPDWLFELGKIFPSSSGVDAFIRDRKSVV